MNKLFAVGCIFALHLLVVHTIFIFLVLRLIVKLGFKLKAAFVGFLAVQRFLHKVIYIRVVK